MKYTCFKGRQHCNLSVFLEVKLKTSFLATVNLSETGEHSLKRYFFKTPGGILRNSYSFDHPKGACI